MRNLIALLVITLCAGLAHAIQLPKTSLPPPWKASASLIHNASFAEDWERYPSPPVILARFKAWFPTITRSNCAMLGPSNQALLGDANPVTGVPVYEQPGAPYIEWFSKCVAELAVAELGNFSGHAETYGETVLKKCWNDKVKTENVETCGLDSFTEVEVDEMINHQLFFLVGDDAMLELRGFGPGGQSIREELRALVAELRTAPTGSMKVESQLINNDNTGRYAVAFIKYLILVRMDQRF